MTESWVAVKMNVSDEHLSEVLEMLPAMKSPTIYPLHKEGWQAVEVAVTEKVARDLIPKLKRAGATAIVEYPLTRVFR